MTGPDPRDDLLRACASPAWAARVGAGWPYLDLATLLTVGQRVWRDLPAREWRAALGAHPRIGDRPPAGSQEQREQSAAETADAAVLAALAAGNVAYERRFGYPFVVRASGREAPEMLGLLHERLTHSPAEELLVAAGQQWEITALRLARLLREEAG